MRWAAPLALVAALCLATPAERAGAQAAPGAPTGISLLAGAGSFTVSWSAPAVDGGSAITSYDLRHIETAATDKADANWTVVSVWTSGDLSYTLAGLRDSTGYDVQVRAANALAGSWSDTSAGTTSDHGDTVSAATAITIGSEVPGRIHAAGDTDHFTFTLDGATYVLLEASTGAGTLSLTPTLYDDHGAEVYLYYLNESGWSVIDDGGLSMYALERLKAGTYTIRIAAAAAGQSGSYLLKPQIAAGQVTDEETCEGYSTAQSDPLYGCQWHLKNTQQYGTGGGASTSTSSRPGPRRRVRASTSSSSTAGWTTSTATSAATSTRAAIRTTTPWATTIPRAACGTPQPSTARGWPGSSRPATTTSAPAAWRRARPSTGTRSAGAVLRSSTRRARAGPPRRPTWPT